MKFIKFIYFVTFMAILVTEAISALFSTLSQTPGGTIILVLLIVIMCITSAFILLPHTPDN